MKRLTKSDRSYWTLEKICTELEKVLIPKFNKMLAEKLKIKLSKYQRRLWTKRENKHLGKVDDRWVAKKFHRTVKAVQRRREKLGISKYPFPYPLD